MRKLKIGYIMIDSNYVSNLPEERRKDLINPDFFQFMYISPHSTLKKFNAEILRVDTKYLTDGKDIDGSLGQLKEKSPQLGSYYIDDLANFYSPQIFRAILYIFKDRKMAFNPIGVSFYPGRYDFEWKTSNYFIRDKTINYNFYLLSKKTDPKTICNCNLKLMWESKIYGMGLWQNLDLSQ